MKSASGDHGRHSCPMDNGQEVVCRRRSGIVRTTHSPVKHKVTHTSTDNKGLVRTASAVSDLVPAEHCLIYVSAPRV